MTLSIYKGKSGISRAFRMSNEMFQHFKSDEIVIIETETHISIREAIINDNKTYKINRTTRAFTYTPWQLTDLYGKYQIEKDGDLFYITDKI